MGVLNREAREIQAKIVYYGPAEAGKTANVEFIHRKLKREHRGDLKVSRVDGDAAYEFVPVTLGSVRGYSTSIHVYTVPSGDEHCELRRQILDGTDGVAFVADLRPERHDATIASAAELKEHLETYGRSFDDVVLVIQYNRRGTTNENALDELHKRLGLDPEAYFEAVATQGTGVLQTLTTLSKQILSNIRRAAEDEPPSDAAVLGQVELTQQPVEEPAARGGFCLESAGPVEASGGELTIPILLTESESGQKVELCLRLSISES